MAAKNQPPQPTQANPAGATVPVASPTPASSVSGLAGPSATPGTAAPAGTMTSGGANPGVAAPVGMMQSGSNNAALAGTLSSSPTEGLAGPQTPPNSPPGATTPPPQTPYGPVGSQYGTGSGVPGDSAYNEAQGAAARIYQNVGGDTGNFINNDQALRDQSINEAAQTYNIAEPGYADFAATGGFTPQMETTYLNRATQGVAGTYDVLAQQAERQRMAAGGLGTGGEISQMARQGTQAQANALEGAQVDLHQMENANKLAGLAGASKLFDTTTNQVTAMGQQILQALGLRYSTQAEAATLLEKLTKDPTGLQQTIAQIQSVAGPVGAALGAL